MELIYFCGILTLLTAAVSGRVIDVLSKPLGKQLFLSKHVVTESGEFDGGVLINGNGIIEAVLTKDVVIPFLAQNPNDLKRAFALAEDVNLPVIDGGELALMAGVVDSHVHVNEPGRTSWEGYVSATQAAAVGGITTIIDMPLNSVPPTTTLENLKIKAAMAKEEVFVDVGFWGGVVPGNEIELHDLIRAGVVGFKCFLTDSGISEFPNVTPNDLTKVFAILNGTGTVLAFHAEVSLNTTDKECTTGCPSPMLFDTYLATHPEEMELKAVSLVTSFLPETDVHVHIVHVSAEGVVPILEAAREKRMKSGYMGWKGGVTAETCHHYLTLSSEQVPPGHSEYKCSPPIRNNTNKQKLWEYIKDERLDLVASDHSPSVDELKGTDFLKAWGGISSVQFGLSLFWTEAKARGHGLNTVSHYLSAGPARLTGLQDRKGSIRPGLDADLIFFDPNASFVVTPEIIRYKNKISPYMNRVLTGIVQSTYVRGQLVYSDGELIGQPKGHLLLTDEIIKTQIPGKEGMGLKIQRNETKELAHLDETGGIEGNSTQGDNTFTIEAEAQDASTFSTSTSYTNLVELNQDYEMNKNYTNSNNETTTSKIQIDINRRTKPENLTSPTIINTGTTTHLQNVSLSAGELIDISKTNETTTISNTITAENLTVATTTESNPVKKWFNNLINRATIFTNNVALLMAVSITIYLSKCIM